MNNQAGLTFGRIGVVLALPLLLWGCTATSISDAGALHLKPHEGLLGLVFINPSGVANFQVKLAGFDGPMLRMDNVRPGENLYLYKLDAGKYCVQSLYMSNSYAYLDWGTHRNCFMVVAGELTYGGTLINNVTDNYIIDMDNFLHLLKEIYPKVYTHYVTGEKTVRKSIL